MGKLSISDLVSRLAVAEMDAELETYIEGLRDEVKDEKCSQEERKENRKLIRYWKEHKKQFLELAAEHELEIHTDNFMDTCQYHFDWLMGEFKLEHGGI